MCSKQEDPNNIISHTAAADSTSDDSDSTEEGIFTNGMVYSY